MRFYVITIEDDADAECVEAWRGQTLRIGPAWEDQFKGVKVKAIDKVTFTEATGLFMRRAMKDRGINEDVAVHYVQEEGAGLDLSTLARPAPLPLPEHAQDWAMPPLRNMVIEDRDPDPYGGRGIPLGDHWEPPLGEAPSDKALGLGPAEDVQAPHHVRRCEANARRGTGTGMCDLPLDDLGQCSRASDHLE